MIWGIFFVIVSLWMMLVSKAHFKEGKPIAGWINLAVSAIDAAVAALHLL